MSINRDSKIIGYFAFIPPMQAVCTGTACVIAGSETSMRQFVEEIRGEKASGEYTIRKTRFSEIVTGMRLGAPYAFDQDSFGRFYPLAIEAGIPVINADFQAAHARGERFLVIQLQGA